MPPFERWLEVKAIFEEALELNPDERTLFLDRACGDSEVRQEVEALLAAPALPTSALGSLLGLPEQGGEPDYAEGDTIDHFVIVRRVGRGGMGVVYEARDTRNNNRPVALKVLFSRAVKLSQDKRIASFTDPSIVTFHDSGETPEGLPYFVFEYIEGEPITTFCERRSLGIPERLRLFQKVCNAVAYAHQRYLIHCDLKPENILVTASGALKLLDFGIAKQIGEDIASNALSPMTLPFASPEQVGGEETTTLSDVYSLGILLCVLLTGRLPYRRARSVADLRDAILYEEPARPSDLVRPRLDSSSDKDELPPYCTPPPAKGPEQLASQLQEDLDAIVLRALSKDPEKRYAFATELAEDIRKHLTIEPVSAHPPSRRYRTKKFLLRRAVPLSIIAVISIVFLVMSVLLFNQYRRAVKEERQASAQAGRTRQVNRFVVDLLRKTNPFDQSPGSDATVDELLDQSSRTIEASLDHYPDLKASFLSVLGGIYSGRGDSARGKALIQNALSLQRHGPRDHALAETLERYGSVLSGQGHYQESDAALTEAQNILSKIGQPSDPLLEASILLVQATNKLNLGDYDSTRRLCQSALTLLRHSPGNFPEIAISLHGIGRTLELKDRDSEAAALYREALSFAERMPDARNPIVANIEDALGVLMYKRGDYVGARAMFQRALDIQRTTLGEGSKVYAVTLHNLAALDSVQGRYREALERFTQVVVILQKRLPSNHLTILTTRDQLASTLVQLHESERAEKIFLEVLAVERATLPKNHPLLATTMNNLGALYVDEGRFEESQAFYQQALEIFEKLVGRKSRPVAGLLGNLGTVAQSRGDNGIAETHYREALDIARGIAGGKSPETFNALVNLASFYISTDNLGKARGLVSEAIPLAEAMVGPTGRLTGSAYALEARLLLAQGDFRGALSRARQGRAILLANLPPLDWRIAVMDSVIGAALGRSGDTAEAEELLLRSLSELRKIKGDHSPQVRDAMERVRMFYKDQGRSDEAAKYRSKRLR
jgi:eukaryotic-like serine/threonine-protein kinase